MKADIHPDYVDRRGALLVRQHVHHAVDLARAARRAVQRVPSLLHGQAEAGRLGWSHRPLRAPLRQAQAQDGRRRLTAPTGPGRRSRRAGSVTLDPERRASLLGRQARRARRGRAWPDATGADGVALQAARSPAARRSGAGPRAGCWSTTDPSGRWARPWPGPASTTSRDLHVLVDHHAGLLARRAAAVRRPAHGVDDRRHRGRAGRAGAGRAPPAPLGGRPGARPSRCAEHGLDVVVDHGEISGEVLGLEVARVVVAPDGSAASRWASVATTARRSP